jgi:hypothetical protein
MDPEKRMVSLAVRRKPRELTDLELAANWESVDAA